MNGVHPGVMFVRQLIVTMAAMYSINTRAGRWVYSGLKPLNVRSTADRDVNAV